MPSRSAENIYPDKKTNKFIMWDISPKHDLYTRKVLVRETDGSWRTGDWDERRFTHEARRYARWRMRVPTHIPDENSDDFWHPDERPPENYKPTLHEIPEEEHDSKIIASELKELGIRKKDHYKSIQNFKIRYD
jgi:hypothetical protein